MLIFVSEIQVVILILSIIMASFSIIELINEEDMKVLSYFLAKSLQEGRIISRQNLNEYLETLH